VTSAYPIVINMRAAPISNSNRTPASQRIVAANGRRRTAQHSWTLLVRIFRATPAMTARKISAGIERPADPKVNKRAPSTE